ncbi:UDP-N-acetylmuramoyl-L-alanyl-D-glutamate--2,6-diaminopimelate ligase [Candidatus Uhrbacteria bacterium]|nr:UDP-N-acetylmuramoyl-L-alanyl-D-glutamate--2,6-diaminopimelate ligase [Candidatus Uhrbacteria bacterium]
MSLKNRLKKALPESWISAYHWALAWLAALAYGFPSERLVVIGVTGTNGKTTVCNLIADILEGAGHRVGLATTANFRVGEREWLNDRKMTMLGRFALQKLIRDMVQDGCGYAVIETSSEGIKQHRQAAINYDLAVFTNLTPEHLESHGGFGNYRAAKGRLFSQLGKGCLKRLGGQLRPKIGLVNLSDPEAGYFLSFPGWKRWGWSVGQPAVGDGTRLDEILEAADVRLTAGGSEFSVRGVPFRLRLLGRFNVENGLAAAAVGLALGISLERSSAVLSGISGIPGRMEPIDGGQPFSVIVDYAPEPESFRKLYGAIGLLETSGRIIHVLGSCGGGRDRDRRPVLGRLAAENADIVVVTDEDPYDDDPKNIIDEVAAGAVRAGKRDGVDLFRVPDRREAIGKAIGMARPGDLVLITGKGAEQAICRADGKKDPWDDRTVARQAIRELFGPKTAI